MTDTREISFRDGTCVSLRGSLGHINLSGVFADAADMADIDVATASRVGAIVCAMLGGLVRDGIPHHVLAELLASHERYADQLKAFADDTDPDTPDATHGVIA